MKFIILLVLYISVGITPDTDYMAQSHKIHVVEIKQMKFVPANIEVTVGDSIRWINRDFVPHNVKQKDELWESPILQKDDTFSIVVKEGASYLCSLHPVMKGQFSIKKVKETNMTP